MPRRPLLLLTILVLALHWLVLQGTSLAWHGSHVAAPAPPVFNTRSIALAPPSPPPAQAAVAAPRQAPARPAPAARTAAKAADAPRPEPAPATAQSPADALATAPPADAAAAPDAVAAAAPEAAVPEAVVPAEVAAAPGTHALANASAPAAPASSTESPTATKPDNPLGAGLEIQPPGGGADRKTSAAPAVLLPAPVRLAFDVSGQAKRFHYSARAELLWQHDGSRYEARQQISAFLVGTRSQTSVGQITPQGLQPERFADRARTEQAAHFDHAQGRVTFSANTPEAHVGQGAQDRLSVFIQLGALIAADPQRFVPGTQVAISTAGARNADRWTFSIEGPQTLDLPAGRMLAWKLQRLPQLDYDQKAELWLAPDLGYMPVRIRLTQANGDFADLQLRSSAAP